MDYDNLCNNIIIILYILKGKKIVKEGKSILFYFFMVEIIILLYSKVSLNINYLVFFWGFLNLYVYINVYWLVFE